ncbi:MAG: hypothetical protein Q9191_006789, partial [Dirinaria sp. TL-2023a]
DVSEANHQSVQMGLSSHANVVSALDETRLAFNEIGDIVSSAALLTKDLNTGPSSTIVEETAKFCSHRDFHYLAYYYFSFKDAARQKTSSMLRSLVLQILRQHSVVPDAVLGIYEGHEHEQPSREGLLKALEAMISKCKQVYIILDALDECPSSNNERAKLVSMLKFFKHFDMTNLHMLVTSRKELDLVDLEKLVTSWPISIQNSDVDNDILLHVRTQLCNDPKLCNWPQEVKDQVEQKLTSGAHGM